MNRVVSAAAILALVVLGVFFYTSRNGMSGDNGQSTQPDKVVQVGNETASGCSCCSQEKSQVAVKACPHCGSDDAQMVATGAAGCCSESEVAASGSCCADKVAAVSTESCSGCPGATTEVAKTSGEASTCPCQKATESVSTTAEGAAGECHGQCETGCCQEKKAEGAAAETQVAEKIEGGNK